MKSFEERIVAALPAHGKTITYGALRADSTCKRGLSELLMSLKETGRISFEFGQGGQITDSTLIRVNETLAPKEFQTKMPPIPGTVIMEMFGFSPAKAVVSVGETGVLSILDPTRRFCTSLHIGPGLWERT